MDIKESMQSSFDSIMAWVDAIAKENEALKSENATLREVLAANKIDIAKEVFNSKAAYDEHLQEILNKKLYDGKFELSVRVLNCLKSADINTLGELVQFKRSDLFKFRNFGHKSIAEIDVLFRKLSKRFGFNFDYEMIPMSEFMKAKIWHRTHGYKVVPWSAWDSMDDAQKIETYHNFVCSS